MKDSPIFGVSGFPNKFINSETGSSKENIFNFLTSLGLGVLELSFTDFNSLSKKDIKVFLESKEKNKTILSVEMFNINIKNKDNVINKYKIFLRKCISLDVKHILIPLGNIKKNNKIDDIISIVKKIRSITPLSINIYPEISGKTNYFGSLDDVIRICSKVKYVYPCLDLGNLHGREFGSLTSSRKIEQVFTIIENFLGKDSLNKTYCKVYPVSYNNKGMIESKLFGEQYYGQMNLFNPSLEYLPKASEYINAIIKKGINPITISKTDHMEEVGAMQLRDIYFMKRKL